MDINKNYSCFERNCIVYAKNIDNEEDFRLTLPEYCSDLFKVVKCEGRSCVSSVDINYNEAKIYAKAEICLTYYDESSNLCYADFDENFTKTVEIDNVRTDSAFSFCSVDDRHLSFRVVNQRRIDIHILTTLNMKVLDKVTCPSVVSCDNSKLRSEKIVLADIFDSVSGKCEFDEDVTLPADLPEIKRIISTTAYAYENELKIIQDKALLKGTVSADILYTADDDSINKCTHTFEFSKIIDSKGLTQDDIVISSLSVGSIYCKLKSSNGNSLSNFEIYGDICVNCVLIKESERVIVTDGYILSCGCDCTYSSIVCDYAGKLVDENISTKTEFSFQNNVSQIKEFSVRISKPYLKNDKLFMKVYACALCICDENLCSVNDVKEISYPADGYKNGFCAADLAGYDYSIKSDNTVEVRLSVKLKCYLYNSAGKKILCEIEPNDKKTDCCEMNLYFAHKGEDLWDVAKAYYSDVDVIMKDNDIKSQTLDSDRVLLILKA